MDLSSLNFDSAKVSFDKKIADMTHEEVHKVRESYAQLCQLSDFRLSGESTFKDFDVASGESVIRTRVHRPNGYGMFPIVLYFHGGWWVGGDEETCGRICQVIADVANVVVVAPGYRLAPESEFPAPFEDACRVLDWAIMNAAQLDGDSEVVAVAGEGTGAVLAAFLTERATRRGERVPTLQLLLDPMFPVGSLSEIFHPVQPLSSPAESMSSFGWSELFSSYSSRIQDLMDSEAAVGSEVAARLPVTLVIGGEASLRDVTLTNYVEGLKRRSGTLGMKYYPDAPLGFISPYGSDNNVGGEALRYAARVLRYSLRQGWDPLLGLER